MRSRAVASLLTLTIMAVCLVSESTAQPTAPKPKADGVVLPVRSTDGTLSGLFMLHRFASENGAIVAVGVISLTPTVTGGATFLKPVSIPVRQIKVGDQIRDFPPIAQGGFAPV